MSRDIAPRRRRRLFALAGAVLVLAGVAVVVVQRVDRPGCSDALAYLATHEAPGFHAVCPAAVPHGYPALTCVNTPGECPGQHVILISGKYAWCRVAWENEASNSQLFYRQEKAGESGGGAQLPNGTNGIDPFGRC